MEDFDSPSDLRDRLLDALGECAAGQNVGDVLAACAVLLLTTLESSMQHTAIAEPPEHRAFRVVMRAFISALEADDLYHESAALTAPAPLGTIQ